MERNELLQGELRELFLEIFKTKKEASKVLEKITGKKLLADLDNPTMVRLKMRLQAHKLGGKLNDSPILEDEDIRDLSAIPTEATNPVVDISASTPPSAEENGAELLPVPVTTSAGPLALTSEESVDKLIGIMRKINRFADQKLKELRPDDFVIFGDTVCLRGAGIDKFISGLPLPLELKNVKELPVRHNGEGYPSYSYEAVAVNTLTGMAMPVYSEENSAKPFYCTRWEKTADGQRRKTKLPPDQVNLRDVRMSAHRGLRKEMVKLFFGLRGLKKAEAIEKGLLVDKILVVPFKE